MKRNIYHPHNHLIKEEHAGIYPGSNKLARKMKAIHLALLAALVMSASLLSVSCNKDFLEKPNGGTFTVDTVFSTQINADMAVARMYNLCIPSWFPRDNGNEMPRPDMLTDAVYYIYPTYSWVGLTNNAAAYTTGNQTADGNVDRGGFGSHYSGIRQANIILKKIDEVKDASQLWKDQVKGQALFCRAFQHFELFRQYGGIPIVVEPLDGTKQLDVRRSAVKTVTDSIVNWCDQAARLLPATWGPADFGRVTSVAARALKARMLLYVASPLYNTPSNMAAEIAEARYGDARDSVLAYPDYDKERWKLAADASKDVIDAAIAAGGALYQTGKAETTPRTDNFEGLGDYEAVFNVYANSELILVNTAHMWVANNGWLFGKYLMSKVRMGAWAVKNNVPIEFAQLYEKRDGTKWTVPLTATGNDFTTWIQEQNLDPRFYQTFAYDGMWYNSQIGTIPYYIGDGGKSPTTDYGRSDAGEDGYALETYKYVARINNRDDRNFAWTIFRLAEFYLNYAEAMNEYTGPSGLPTTYLNMIRKRAGMPDKNPGSVEAFREAIQNERSVELSYEGHRLNDLQRWLKAHSTLNVALHGFQTRANNSSGTLQRNWKIVSFMNRVWPKKYYYLPFPNAQVSNNYLGDGASWLGQNPGW